jgi:hypothetical protein
MFASFKQSPIPWKNIPVLYLSLLPRVAPEWLDEYTPLSLSIKIRKIKEKNRHYQKTIKFGGILRECDSSSLYKALRAPTAARKERKCHLVLQ